LIDRPGGDVRLFERLDRGGVRARFLGQLVARGGEFSQGQLIETIDVGRHD
jgi:hypothetical protein